jgi:membrane protease YdiL (CAAX protease family)
MIKAILIAIVASLCVGEFYSFSQRKLPFEPWMDLLLVNICLAALGLLIYSRLRKHLFQIGHVGWTFVPSAVVLGGAWTLATIYPSARLEIQPSQAQVLFWVATVSIIPCVEEVLFRGVVASWLDKFLGQNFASLYASSLIFCFVHAMPTVQKVFSFNIAISLGTFLVGLVCHWLYRRSNSLLAPILFHASCNGTVIIFSLKSPKWFQTLNFLFL